MLNVKRKVAVIGRGVCGLTSALSFLESGYQVDLFSKDDPLNTTSVAAGAYWWPHKAYPKEKVLKWSRESLKVYKRLAKDSQSGVFFHEHFRYCPEPEEAAYVLPELDDWEEIKAEINGIKCHSAYRAVVPLIDTSIFMPFLDSKVQQAGGRFYVRELHSPTELFSEYDVVINCSGIGARQLVNDKLVYPIRGQTIKISKPKDLNRSVTFRDSGKFFPLILPRTNDCILGTTNEKDNWSRVVDDKTSGEIIRRCLALLPEIDGFEILGTSVGLRPGRSEIRLELEMHDGQNPIIHNYGHGGGGFTVAFGCASEVLEIAKNSRKS